MSAFDFLVNASFALHISILYFYPESKPSRLYGWLHAIIAALFALCALSKFLA